MSLFSIIIPVYNAQSWLCQCLESVVKQTFTDFEIILVNDGSTDKSKEIIEGFISKNNNLEWNLINQENRGLGNARNVAVANANGKWLCFLDSDDYWSTHKLLQCHLFIKEQGNLQWFYHEVYEKHPSGRMRERQGFSFTSVDEWIETGNPIVPSATIIRKKLFEKHLGFDEERDRVEDLGFWLRLFETNNFPQFLEETLTVYRLGSGLTANAEDHFKKVKKVIDKALENNQLSKKQVEVFMLRKTYEFARQRHKFKNFKAAIKGYKTVTINWKVRVLLLLARIKISI